MTYSEPLADQVRALLSDRDDVVERPMFGDELIIRLHPEEEQALRDWVELAVAHAETQPPKQPRPKAVKR